MIIIKIFGFITVILTFGIVILFSINEIVYRKARRKKWLIADSIAFVFSVGAIFILARLSDSKTNIEPRNDSLDSESGLSADMLTTVNETDDEEIFRESDAGDVNSVSIAMKDTSFREALSIREVNPIKANELFAESCKKNNYPSCTEWSNIALLRNNQKQIPKAIRRLARSCGAGYSYACDLLSEQYERSVVENLLTEGKLRAVERDAIHELIVKKCHDKNYSACNALGVAYKSGIGVKKSGAEAGRYFKAACDIAEVSKNINHPHACGSLASYYARGKNPFEKNLNEANRLYQFICDDRKIPWGCYQWGDFLASGMMAGASAQAKEAFRKGCELGYVPSCARLDSPQDSTSNE